MADASVDVPPKKATNKDGKEAGQTARPVGVQVVVDGLTKRLADHFMCPSCQFLLRDPVQAQCGHRLCKRCFQFLLDQGDGDSAKCPVDGETIPKNMVFKDLYAAKEINGLTVLCSSKRHAKTDQDWCLWRGIMKDFEGHEKDCKFVRVICTECAEAIERQSLVTHKMKTCSWRQAKCGHCNEEMPWNDIKTHQEKSCPEMVIPCPNNCSAAPLPRKTVDAHLKACPLHKVNCYYNASGCEFKGPRQDLRSHHDSSLQFHLQLVERTAQEAKTRGSTSGLATANGTKLVKLEDSLMGTNDIIEQQGALLREQSARVRECEEQLMEVRDTLAVTQAACLELTSQFKALEEKFSHFSAASSAAASAALVQQVDENSQRLTRLDRTVALHDLQLSDQSMRQDILEVRSQTGTMVWKISELERRKREAATGKTPSLYSPPFYTSACGYKMCLRLYLNGDGAGHGTHMSLFFAIMRGDFDGLLKWPFQQKVTLMLLNQAPIGAEAASGHIVETFKPDITSSSFHRPDSDMNVATGCPTFAPLSMLQIGSRFVRDDSLFVKVCVDLTRVPVPDAHLGTGRLL